MIYDAEALITEIRSLAGLPPDEVPGYTKADLLRHASSFIRARLLPLVVSKREDYFIQRCQIPIVPGVSQYRIPERAVGDKLRAIWYLDASGNRRKTEPIVPSDLHKYTSASSTLHGFYLTANHIVLVGNPGTGVLEVLFPFRVGDIVFQTEARQTAVAPPGPASVTLASAAPASWAAGTKVDIHSELGGHDLRMWGARISSIDPTRTILVLDRAVDGSVPGTMPVTGGDWVCLERQSALIALPEELVPALARGVAQRVAEAEHDTEAMQHHAGELDKDAAAVMPLIAQERVQAKAERFKGRNSPFFGA